MRDIGKHTLSFWFDALVTDAANLTTAPKRGAAVTESIATR